MGLWSRFVLPRLVEKACKSAAILAERRRWIPEARGEVLELGVGSGLNLGFYDPARATRVTGVDPSPPLLARARARAAAAAVPVALVTAAGERLPFSAGMFDSAVVTYSLCSMADPVAALVEVRRVLRPRGALLFVEHGLAPDPGTRRWQRWLTPAWRRAGGGCRLDRDIAAIVRAAGFALDELDTGYSDGVRWLSYTYQGRAHPAR